MPNPFVYGARITDPARFVGREAELRRIFSTLDTAHTGQLQSVSVVGQRRLGRSSLLYHLTQVYPRRLSRPEQYVFAYVDLESGKYNRLDALLKGILSELAAALPAPASEGQAELREHLRNAIRDTEITFAGFETAVQRFRALPGQSLFPVVCLDEFEQLIAHADEFPDRLYNSWRSLMNGSELAFVIASTRPLAQLSRAKSLTSPFFNIFSTVVELGEFTAAEAQELIDRGRTCDRPFGDEDCRRALALAGRHPWKLQLAGSLIYDAKAAPQVAWKAVEREYRRHVRYLLGEPRRDRPVTAKGMILALGGVVNTLLGRPADDERNNWIMGWTALAVLVVFVALVLLGLLPPLIWVVSRL